MRNKEKEEIPLVNIERSPLILFIFLAASLLMGALAYKLFINFSPWIFLVVVPTAVLAFQTLWLLLNPFAIVFDDKLEIKQSLLHYKECYFIDLKSVTKNKKGNLYVTYRDDEVERIPLFGIKTAHVDLMKIELEKMISRI